MGRILVVGNATLDIINALDHYPREDEEVRAERQFVSRGGNSANTVVVLSQLGHQCAWAGTVADDANSALILKDLERYNIDTSAQHTSRGGSAPTSYITLNTSSGSRTIVHYRDLPEYDFHDFQRINLLQFDWIHFEGRNIEQVGRMMEHAQKSNRRVKLSLEVEKPRPGIENLFGLPDLLLFSHDYAGKQGFDSAEQFLQELAKQGIGGTATCSWGSEGAYGIVDDGTVEHSPAYAPEKVVDTLGAGDAFNAGMIDALLQRKPLTEALTAATQLAGKKCGVYGLEKIER